MTDPQDDDLGRLIRRAPRYPGPDPAAKQRAFEVVAEAWREGRAEARSPLRRAWPAAAAAAAALVVVAGLTWQRFTAPPVVAVATVQRIEGRVTAIESGWFGGSRELAVAGTVNSDETLQTAGDARIVLREANGLSLRLAPSTRIALLSPQNVHLESGELYVDADPALGAAPLTVQTAFGSVRHFGTQYAVRSAGDAPGREPSSVEVAVREGRVQLTRAAGEALAIEAGEALRLGRGGDVARRPLPTDDASWNWLQQTAAPIEIDGHTLAEFLRWYSRETGRPVTVSAGVAAPQTIRLSGSILGLTPDEALAAVAASTDLAIRRFADHIELQPPAARP